MENSSFNATFARETVPPMFSLWQSFWQRYIDNSTKMMSTWMTLPFEIMNSVKPEVPVTSADEQATATSNAALLGTTALSQNAAAASQPLSSNNDHASH